MTLAFTSSSTPTATSTSVAKESSLYITHCSQRWIQQGAAGAGAPPTPSWTLCIPVAPTVMTIEEGEGYSMEVEEDVGDLSCITALGSHQPTKQPKASSPLSGTLLQSLIHLSPDSKPPTDTYPLCSPIREAILATSVACNMASSSLGNRV